MLFVKNLKTLTESAAFLPNCHEKRQNKSINSSHTRLLNSIFPSPSYKQCKASIQISIPIALGLLGSPLWHLGAT